jgi:hypothetical protein
MPVKAGETPTGSLFAFLQRGFSRPSRRSNTGQDAWSEQQENKTFSVAIRRTDDRHSDNSQERALYNADQPQSAKQGERDDRNAHEQNKKQLSRFQLGLPPAGRGQLLHSNAWADHAIIPSDFAGT